MASWRDEMSAAAQAELDSLLETALRLARGHLDKASEFTPFAVFLSDEGKYILVEYDTASKAKAPTVETILVNLLEQLRTMGRQARCTAIALNTRLEKERTDALEFRLEHRDGGSVVVLLPYKRALFGGSTEYAAPHAYTGKRLVWA